MAPAHRPALPSLAGPGEWLAWLAAILVTLCPFFGWYSSTGPGPTVSVLGWHTGTLGKLVFFAGLAAIVLLVLRATGLELPPTVPSGAVLAGIGALATIFVLVRVIDVPDRFSGAGRGLGIWLSLLAGLLLVVAGLVRANEEL